MVDGRRVALTTVSQCDAGGALGWAVAAANGGRRCAR